MRHVCAVSLVLTFAALLSGCYGDGGPPLAAINGTITLDGKPLVAKTVHFIPEPGTPGVGAGATTGEDGRYTLIAARPGAVVDTMGVPPGDYRVIVVEPMFPIDLPEAEQSGDAPAAAIGLPDARVRRQTTIPAPYTSAQTTPLRIKVPDEGGVIDLKLVSKH